MADVVAKQGLVQVMGPAVRTGELPADWLGPASRSPSPPHRSDFRARWAERSEQLTAATRKRLLWQRNAGNLRDDVSVDVLTAYLELVLEGLVSHLAMGLPADDLEPVLDLVEESVRRHRGLGSPESAG